MKSPVSLVIERIIVLVFVVLRLFGVVVFEQTLTYGMFTVRVFLILPK